MLNSTKPGTESAPPGIDADAAAALVAEAEARGEALDLYVPGIPALAIRGSLPRRRLGFGTPFLTVFPQGLAFAIEHLTHRELRVFAVLAMVQGPGETPLPLRVTDIAVQTGLTASAVSRAVARMRALGILQPGRTGDGQVVGLRFSRRVLFLGKVSLFRQLRTDPPLVDPNEAPNIEQAGRNQLRPAARGALAAKTNRPRSQSGNNDGGADGQGASGSVERPDGGAASAGPQAATRGRPRPSSPRPDGLPHQSTDGLPGECDALPAGVA